MLQVNSGLVPGAVALVSSTFLGVFWYGSGVRVVPPDAMLLTAIETNDYVDSYSFTVPIQNENVPKSIVPKTLTHSLVAQALYTCPAFQIERVLLTAAGWAPPKPMEFQKAVGDLPIGCKIGPWEVVQMSADQDKLTSVLLEWPGGHTFVKAGFVLGTDNGVEQSGQKTYQLEFTLGSSLRASLSSSIVGQALMPFHHLYSRILCRNAANHLKRLLKV
mmetsp:Transcript_23261/g.48355  ORF Transcript_23261/g.48355 Transcript_23261/m.48355 type:complete len:218 (-) Transcript_23261:253-906(-)|eukprot:CAMPEP_0172460750 /NCGR_PEP_ID=MMETSP1065-20121228/38105_1 /TAXON_ID=265537 /ORGANISM="Amphiprora paludosa, Strain CCMP125" /LENGTH=217 /DNA_ID=CAMNT_0013215879 /DNA_START=193 /DNA_END=846 /DNA_ORIENTATION=-